MLHGLGVTEIIENLFKGVSGRMQFWKISFEKYFIILRNSKDVKTKLQRRFKKS